MELKSIDRDREQNISDLSDLRLYESVSYRKVQAQLGGSIPICLNNFDGIRGVLSIGGMPQVDGVVIALEPLRDVKAVLKNLIFEYFLYKRWPWLFTNPVVTNA